MASKLKILFLAVFLTAAEAKTVTIFYNPPAGKTLEYSLEMTIHQQLESIESKKPAALTPTSSVLNFTARFSLKFSTSAEGFVETYTLKSATVSFSAGGVKSEIGESVRKFIGKTWSIPVSTSGKVSSKDMGFHVFVSNEIFGRKLKIGKKIKTVSRVNYPLLDMILATETKTSYKPEKIAGKNLVLFSFESEASGSAHYPKLKNYMAESEITGKGSGTFIYNRKESAIENVSAVFDFSSNVFSHGKKLKPQKMKMKQQIEINVKKRKMGEGRW